MTAVTAIPRLEHDEAMALAEVELGRVLALVDDLGADDWGRPPTARAGRCATCSGTCSACSRCRPTPRSAPGRSRPPPSCRAGRGAAADRDDGAAGA